MASLELLDKAAKSVSSVVTPVAWIPNGGPGTVKCFTSNGVVVFSKDSVEWAAVYPLGGENQWVRTIVEG